MATLFSQILHSGHPGVGNFKAAASHDSSGRELTSIIPVEVSCGRAHILYTTGSKLFPIGTLSLQTNDRFRNRIISHKSTLSSSCKFREEASGQSHRCRIPSASIVRKLNGRIRWMVCTRLTRNAGNKQSELTGEGVQRHTCLGRNQGLRNNKCFCTTAVGLIPGDDCGSLLDRAELSHNVGSILSSENSIIGEDLDWLRHSANASFLKWSGDLVERTGDSSQRFQFLRQTSSNIFHSPTLEGLGHSASRLLYTAGALTNEIGLQVSHLTGVHLDSSSLNSSAGRLAGQIGTALLGYYDGLAAGDATTVTALAAVAGSAVAIASANDNRNKPFVEGEDIPLRYDPSAVGAYFKRRPVDILLRSVKIMFECSTLVVNILFDHFVGRARQTEMRRAAQLVDLITRLGPTAIKIGQALSIRPDILPVVYIRELEKLQDRVPPFSSEDARKLIQSGLGRSAEEIFSEISDAPIAAASLGQVYKARLRQSGAYVAVKVQRPGVLEGISRDLFLLRFFATIFQEIPLNKSDLVALLDTWALRFFDELDYMQEGKNAIQFAENMKGLSNITVPEVYMEYTSRKVLTTAWVEGEKLSESKADDLLPLVTTALNCYLMQLLESGFLHADPHPGNLLRTPDGRLCVLDFGLMTQVTEEQRYTLIEYISHLVNSDYARVAEDLVRLGFVPPELADPQKTAAVVPQLSRVFSQLVQGGGARKINIAQVSNDLASMAQDYVFVIPPYFALILRAFSVLEGIGLDADPDYTIVDECYPYICKRLLTDDSPRTRAALKYFLYADKGQLAVDRVEEIMSGFQSFRDLMAPSGDDGRKVQKFQLIDPTTKEALILIFAPEGSYIQELLLTELVRSADALSREALAELWRILVSTIRISLPPALSKQGSWPLPVPGLLLGMGPVATLSEEDQLSLNTIRRLWALAEPTFTQLSPVGFLELARDVSPLLFDLFPGVTTAARRFIVMLWQRQAFRFADDLEGTNSVLEWDRDPAASARGIQPFTIFTFQGATRIPT